MAAQGGCRRNSAALFAQLLLCSCFSFILLRPVRCQSASPEPTPVPASTDSGGSNDKVLIGVIVGIVGFIVLKSACLFYVCYWRPKQRGRGRWNIANNKPPGKRATSAKSDGSLEEWELDLSNVQICKTKDGQLWELGKGGFGRVFKGVRAEVQPVAVKMVVQSADRKAHEGFVHEIAMLKFVSRDRNIVQFYGAGVSDNNQLWLVTELMEGGDLRQALSSELPNRVTWWNGGKPIAMDVARGLAFLHANRVIHRDLKSKNILLTAEGQAKIGDVGMAKIMSEGYFSHDEAFGTFAWAAPELLLNDRCTDKVDIYSLGVVIWEIVTGELPMRGSIVTPDVPRQCPQEVAQIVQECMRRDPAARPTPGEVFRRLAMCPPNARKSPILDSAEEQMGMASHMAANDKQLMDLMRSLSHDGNSTLYGNKSPGDSVVSMGLDSSSAPYNSSNSAMSGIQEEPGLGSRLEEGKSELVARPHPPSADNGYHYLQNTDSNSHAFDSTTSGTSRFTNSTNPDSTDSFQLQPQSFSLSPNGDVVVEIEGLPRRLPVDGNKLLREQQGKKAGGQGGVRDKAPRKHWLRR